MITRPNYLLFAVGFVLGMDAAVTFLGYSGLGLVLSLLGLVLVFMMFGEILRHFKEDENC